MATIRTYSQLLKVDSLHDDDIFCVSHDNSSVAVTLSSIKCTISESITNDVLNTLSVDKSLSLSVTTSFVNDLSSCISINNDDENNFIRYENAPKVNLVSEDDDSVLTKNLIINLIHGQNNCIASTSFIKINPYNSRGHTKEYLYMWKIENGKRDSEISKDENGFSMNVKIKEDGLLTVYGWLTAPKNLLPHKAWVGIYGKISTPQSGEDGEWVLLLILPWISGVNSTYMLYVGFNITVKKGLEVKIMTGFEVDGTYSGFLINDGSSLLLTEIGNTPNTFVGYVIEQR